MVEEIHETNESLDLVTNTRIIKTNLKTTILGSGEAWFNLHTIMNMIRYAEMAKHHQITYDLKQENALIVHLPGKLVKFIKIGQELYVLKLEIKNSKSTKVQLLTQTKKNAIV
jgi:hypothetical protein